MAIFNPCDPSLFFKSTKPMDTRLGEIAIPASETLPEGAVHLAGYPDDEGIRLNGGRAGAGQAPDVIRKYFYKMTPSAWAPTELTLIDRGNLKSLGSLEERHRELQQEVTLALQARGRWIGLGGGHDYGYPDAAGFLASLRESTYKPLVINFDAHLDVRPIDQGLSSGTPFFRLLSDQTLPAFDFLEVGLQAQCNSPAHLQWLRKRGGQAWSLDDLLLKGQFVETFMEAAAPYLLHPRPTFLSVDIDAFSSAFAPGCSQSWSTGLVPNDFIRLLRLLKKRLDLRGLRIYEVSPPLDQDDRTSKLAAQILHAFLYGA